MKKCFLFLALCSLLIVSLVGCSHSSLPTEEDSLSEIQEYDVSRFYIKTVHYELCNEYIVCYGNDKHEIVNIGTTPQPLIITNDRIFYCCYGSLASTDFDGKEQELSHFNDDIAVEQINSTDGEWLYCSGKKRVEIYNDPVALDGVHFIPANFKVKIDFSEYSEIE